MDMRSGAPGSAAAQCSPSPSTTFVHADAATFKELVQRLTGPRAVAGAGTDDHIPHPPPSLPLPPPNEAFASSSSAKLSGAKRLHERRQAFRPKLAIVKPAGSQSLPATPSGFLSPAMSPLVMSPSAHFATLNLTCDRLIRGSSGAGAELNEEEEERAIKERRFYLHPSPRSRTRIAEPDLLPLFPMASPRPREH